MAPATPSRPRTAAAAAAKSLITLLPYQREALVSIWGLVQRARKRQQAGELGPLRGCCVQPTGAGKTVEMLCLVREVVARYGWKAIAVEPTRGLVGQTLKRAKQFIPHCSFGSFKRARKFEELDLVVSTAGALNKKGLSRIDPSHFQLVLIDEAHHAASDTYELILNHFSGAVLIIGLTATWIRGSGESIATDKYFQSVVVYQTIGQLTAAKALVPAKGFYFHTGLVLENVPIRKGDYDKKKLAHAVNTPERNAMVVDAWERHAAGRMTLVFTIDIDHARNVEQAFLTRGIKAAAVWGKMNPDDYDRIMEEFHTGRIDVVANSKLLSEGFDEKRVSCCILTRPGTEAAGRVLGPQMIGRALRLHPESGKQDAVIVELMDKAIYPGSAGSRSVELSSVLAGSYGVSKKRIESESAYLHDQSRVERAEQGWRERLKMYQSLRTVEAVEQTFDVIERVSKVSEYAWLPLGLTTYFMPIKDGGFIEVVFEHENYFEVRAVEERELTFIGSGSTLKEAMSVADSWVARHGLNFNLQVRSRPWRNLRPSDGQVFKAHKLTGLSQEFLTGLTRGQVSDLITSAEALLLPLEDLRVSGSSGLPDALPVDARGSLHVWQFGQTS